MKALLLIALIACLIAWSGGYQGLEVYSLPVMYWLVMLIFVIQWLAFIPAYIWQTERYYDLLGSGTYIAVTVLALFLAGAVASRSLLLAIFVVVWAGRLGSFLFVRILQDGSDSRFDKIKPSPLLFFRTWSLQGLWVTVTAGAALAAINSREAIDLQWWDGFAVALWVLGFAIEVIADRQKRQFRREHGGSRFISGGLWAYSRHPNYLGEIMLWSAVALLAAPQLQGWQLVTLVSPLFVYLLLTRVSGIVLLEHKADRRWGDDPAYVEYRARTPILVPRLKR